MKQLTAIFLFILPLVLWAENPLLLSEIQASLEAYQGRTVTMILRLKNHDRVFEKILFYDARNHDIEFHVPQRGMAKQLKENFLNLHEGLEYSVTFRVTGRGKMGLITGELLECSPVVLKKLP